MRYEEFVVEIRPPLRGRKFPVSVRSPAGIGYGSFRDPFPEKLLGDIPEVIGTTLFNALFQDGVRHLYSMSLGMIARHPSRGLRIQIQIDPTHAMLRRIASYPWETLFDPGIQQFLALDCRTPIVRGLGVLRPFRPATLDRPLHILAVAPNPWGFLPPLDLAKERNNLEKACARNRQARLTFLESPCTPEALREQLQHKEEGFKILHFMGHGTFGQDGQGRLLFEDRNRRPVFLKAEDLKDLIGEFETLRMIFLNACNTAPFGTPNPFTGVAGALVQRGFPAVIAIGSTIEDEAAIAFSCAFYRTLLEGEPPEAAILEGRLAVKLLSLPTADWELPVLFIRSHESVRPRRLVLLIKSAAAGLALSAIAPTSWTAWHSLEPADPGAEVAIDVRADWTSVPSWPEVRGKLKNLQSHNDRSVRVPDEDCWLRESFILDPEWWWIARDQFLGAPGEPYGRFISESTPAVRQVRLDNNWPSVAHSSNAHEHNQGISIVWHPVRELRRDGKDLRVPSLEEQPAEVEARDK